MTLTDIGKNFAVANAMCIVAALSFARDAAKDGTFDTVKYGTLTNEWLLNLQD